MMNLLYLESVKESKDIDDKLDDNESQSKPHRIPSTNCPLCGLEVRLFKRHMKTKHTEIPPELYLVYVKEIKNKGKGKKPPAAKKERKKEPDLSNLC